MMLFDEISSISLPTVLMGASSATCFLLERVRPGRRLPNSRGWYGRAILVTLAQLAITLLTARLWIRIFGDLSLFHLSHWNSPMLEGFAGWLAGTFVFYWWHRLRHAKGWWLAFHQIHHSPSRIELLTSFYKHPVEILCDALVSALILYPLMGCSLLGAFWYNYADIPAWDRLFGTYRDTTEFATRCGFPDGAESRLIPMLAFRDVHAEKYRRRDWVDSRTG